ncbi:unnamed protein product [Adineta steineri]|uniref:MAM domain-containing protein n=1 Tax=Adineta steineri TaxID=433720 RepID=A0A819IHK4_9BILA|nr:unnamed protein product [Adineta steineri]
MRSFYLFFCIIMLSPITYVFTVWCFVVILHTEAHIFFCNFESNSTCSIENGSPIDPEPPSINFTIQSPQTITYQDLGPFSGHSFFYWSRSDNFPHAEEFNGRAHTPKFNQTNGENMCLEFMYYIKSTGTDNGTWLDVSTGGCYAASLFFIEQDDSNGWQTITVPLHKGNCSISLYFTVNQRTPVRMALALDNIIVDWCDALIETTTIPGISNSSQLIFNTSFFVLIFILFLLK